MAIRVYVWWFFMWLVPPPLEVQYSQLDKDDDVTMANKDTYDFDDYF